jgi:hypothetical protein
MQTQPRPCFEEVTPYKFEEAPRVEEYFLISNEIMAYYFDNILGIF